MKIAFFTYSMNVGGVETFLMNVLNELDTKKYKIDFICYKNLSDEKRMFIEKNNAHAIQIVNPDEVGMKIYIRSLYDIIKKGEYDIVYSNTFTNSAYVMLISFLCGVKKRITHSHTAKSLKTKNIKKFVKWNISRLLIKIFATKKIACGIEAGKMLYKNNKFMVLGNGIYVDKFKYSLDLKNKLRKKYKISKNDKVIGHIGRFTNEKNHIFLIEMFLELLKINDNYKLFLVGDGPNYKEINAIVKEKNLSDKVIFTGMVDNPNIYYNIMDMFVLPSLFEGFPLTIIEAQTNGLPCLCSDNVPTEVNITGNVKFLKLENNNWINEICKKNERYDEFKKIKASNYNIENTVSEIVKIFEE